jgi:hypothetical protein
MSRGASTPRGEDQRPQVGVHQRLVGHLLAAGGFDGQQVGPRLGGEVEQLHHAVPISAPAHQGRPLVVPVVVGGQAQGVLQAMLIVIGAQRVAEDARDLGALLGPHGHGRQGFELDQQRRQTLSIIWVYWPRTSGQVLSVISIGGRVKLISGTTVPVPSCTPRPHVTGRGARPKTKSSNDFTARDGPNGEGGELIKCSGASCRRCAPATSGDFRGPSHVELDEPWRVRS